MQFLLPESFYPFLHPNLHIFFTNTHFNNIELEHLLEHFSSEDKIGVDMKMFNTLS